MDLSVARQHRAEMGAAHEKPRCPFAARAYNFRHPHVPHDDELCGKVGDDDVRKAA